MGSKPTGTFFKGVALGAAVAMVTLVGSAAVAGTGVGKIFNLGEANRVNARTQLEGSTPSAVLNVTNTNKSASANGVSIDVPATDPPLVVNSDTKVKHLNADLLDGQDASTFQGATSKACPNGTAISSITPNGNATCNTGVVLPIDTHEPPNSAGSVDYPPSSLRLVFSCSQAPTRTNVSFENLGAAPAELDTFMSEATGTADTELGAYGINSNEAHAFAVLVAGEFAGQFIYFDQTTVTTVNINVIDMGTDGCDYHGTVEEAARS